MQMSTHSVFISVKWNNNLGGVRKVNFSVGIKISGAFYTENKMPKHFKANEKAIVACLFFLSYPVPSLSLKPMLSEFSQA